MNKCYIIAAKRTAIGKFLGTLTPVSAAELATVVIKDILNTTQIDPTLLDEVIVGNVLSAGQGQGIARQAAIKAGIPVDVKIKFQTLWRDGEKYIVGLSVYSVGKCPVGVGRRHRIDVKCRLYSTWRCASGI